MAQDRLVISMNLLSHAVSQYREFDFNSFAVLDDKAYGFNEDGIFLLDSGDIDGVSGDPIEWRIVFPPVNYQSGAKKRIRRCILMGDVQDVVALGIQVDKRSEEQHYNTGIENDRVFTLPRDGSIGRHITVSLEGVDGSDFDLHGIDLVMLTTYLGGSH